MEHTLLIITSVEFVTYTLVAIAAIAIYYFMTQWIFEIKKRNRYMEAQIKLLAKIAQKQGVSIDEIEVIQRVAQG